MALSHQSRLSSLPLQMLLFFNQWYTYLFTLANIIVYIYKAQVLPYPPNTFGWEIVILLLLFIAENLRLFLASTGNKLESVGPCVWSLILAVPIIVVYTYFIRLQIYVLRIDVAMGVVGLIFVSLECVLLIVAGMAFLRSARFM